MNGTYELNIGGADRTLRFNNFAIIEISKMVFDKGHLVSNPDEVLDRLYEIADSNIMVLLKILVYGGILGNDYVVGFKPSVTQEDVAGWVADVPQTELLKIWEIFLEAMGLHIGADETLSQDDDENPTVEKKS